MKSKVSHDIKHRAVPNDEFYTPIELAKTCIALVPIGFKDTVLDSAYGGGAFWENLPKCSTNYSTREFENWTQPVDWIVTNPPYSLLNKWWLPHTYELAQKGFGYLIGQGNLTCKRIEEANAAGFGLTKLHMCKVFKWFGMSYFVVFEKGKPNIISFDRKVWR